MIALDLFAGTGWGVACDTLGIEEYGVEIMPEAVASRERNGMRTIYRDVWMGIDGRIDPTYHTGGDYDILIASPPCQTFSMAGGGAGRKALDEVLGLIDARAYLDVAALRAFGEAHDPRTALVLTPLAHVARDVPMYVVFEQVPPVLPVWERCAEEMRKWGYSVWTGNLQAEQYGVPQTRKRAVLIARADGVEAAPPTPTHSRYYSRDPKRLDPGVLPWVSMAEALGWGMTERPFVTAGNAVGRAEGIGGSGGKAAVEREKDRGAWLVGFARRADDKGAATPDGYRARDLRADTEPAQHVTEKARSWTRRRPATTVAADERIAGPGRREFVKGGISRQAMPGTERVTVEEAAALQSYPPGFTFAGTKTKQFLQIGNAVPPLLAEAILRAVTS
jgi:DNA (cytosine-5)-methyltransferase 1